MNLTTYLNALSKRLKLPASERDAVIAEVRSHLVEDASRRVSEGLSKEAAMEAAIADFGAPQEIAIAYSPTQTEFRSDNGELLLTIGRGALATGKAVGRGAGHVLKWVGITAAVLVGIALVLVVSGLLFAGTVLTAYQDEISEAVPRPVYHFSESYPLTGPRADVQSDTFQIGEDVKEFRISIHVAPDAGCVPIRITGPDGSEQSLNGNGCSETSRMLTYTDHGTWTVDYTFAAYTGSVTVDVYSFEYAN